MSHLNQKPQYNTRGVQGDADILRDTAVLLHAAQRLLLLHQDGQVLQDGRGVQGQLRPRLQPALPASGVSECDIPS